MQFGTHHSVKPRGNSAPTRSPFAEPVAFAARRTAVLRCLFPSFSYTKMFVFSKEMPSRVMKPQLPSQPACHPFVLLQTQVVPRSRMRHVHGRGWTGRQGADQLGKPPVDRAVCAFKGQVRIEKRRSASQAGIVFISSYAYT